MSKKSKKNLAGGNTETPAETPSKQVHQYSYWFFTLNNYTVEDIEQLEQIFKHECKWYIFQEETGELGTPHLQGTISLKQRQRMTELKKLHNSIHWENTKCVKASIEYCTKFQTRTGQIWSHGIEVPEQLDLDEPYGWQLKVLEICKTKADKRTINWFWEKKGNVGKTTLCKYLVAKMDALMVTGKATDIYHMISKFPKKRKIIIFDIPRSSFGYISYPALEQVKNGLIFSGKYEGCQLIFNSPHVFVFANEPPDLDECSHDRWNVVEIST